MVERRNVSKLRFLSRIFRQRTSDYDRDLTFQEALVEKALGLDESF